MKLSATKTVYIIKAGCERFLVAGDTANTTLLAKLDENNLPPVVENNSEQTQEVKIPNLKDILNKFNRG
jgi:flagellar biogenesis protein FliO